MTLMFDDWEDLVGTPSGVTNTKETVDALIRKAISDDSGGDRGLNAATYIWLNLHPDRDYIAPELHEERARLNAERMVESIFSPNDGRGFIDPVNHRETPTPKVMRLKRLIIWALVSIPLTVFVILYFEL